MPHDSLSLSLRESVRVFAMDSRILPPSLPPSRTYYADNYKYIRCECCINVIAVCMLLLRACMIVTTASDPIR